MPAASQCRPSGPHQAIVTSDPRERFALELLDCLWERYSGRVEYARVYQQVVSKAGGTFVNDHIAFRTFAASPPLTGIVAISRIFEALGYRAAGCYQFPDKHLSAIHYQHPNGLFPKIFISELQTWELSSSTRSLIERYVADHREPMGSDTLAALFSLGDQTDRERFRLMESHVDWFHRLPWRVPEKDDIIAANAQSQYAAWVLVHGYHVNHFTSLVNSHVVAELDNIEKTVAAMQAAGVPMKPEIEGPRGSKLRQSATEAVQIDVDVLDRGRPSTMPWTYAYLEIAERGTVTDPETGQPRRFEGFLGPQATNLFEMTKIATT